MGARVLWSLPSGHTFLKAPSHPPLLALFFFLSYCPRLQAIRTTACVSGTEKSGEARKEGSLLLSPNPLISDSGLLVQYKESDNWGSLKSGGTHGLDLYKAGFLFPPLSLYWEGQRACWGKSWAVVLM